MRMKLSDWNKSLVYVAYECAEFPNIGWYVYTMYDGRKGITLFIQDSIGEIFAEQNTGIWDSFDEMKAAIQRCIRRLMEV